METVGVYLKMEREAKNISLDEASRLTKISECYLEYIEKNEFAKLPQGPYIKGYIASYSKLIGGNVDEALKLYESLNAKRNQTEKIHSENENSNDGDNTLRKTKANKKEKATLSRTWLYAFIALFGTGILVLAGFGFYHLFIYDQNQLFVAELQKMEDKKLSSSLSTNSDTAIARTTLTSEKTTRMPKPAQQTSTSLSGLYSSADNIATSQTTNGTESNAPLDPHRMAASSPPELATAAVNVKVWKASVCSGIKNRMPAGVDTIFPMSAQRVFVWNEIESERIPTRIRHIYYLNGQKSSDITLDVRSTYWRTWSSKSISNNRYRGEWRVDIVSAAGNVLRSLYFDVK